LAKDRTPATGKDRPAGKGSSAAGRPGGKGGRTRPVANVVTAPRRPWGLIAAAVAVVVFAAAVITYAVVQVNNANADKVDSVDEIDGIQTFDAYEEPQDHVDTVVDYAESPPVGGPHAPPPEWADCTGTVYDVDIRHENAVHSLEHGAVWIAFGTEVDTATLDVIREAIVGTTHVIASPYPDLDTSIVMSAWSRQLTLDDVSDPRFREFLDTYVQGPQTPELGAPCSGAIGTPANV